MIQSYKHTTDNERKAYLEVFRKAIPESVIKRLLGSDDYTEDQLTELAYSFAEVGGYFRRLFFAEDRVKAGDIEVSEYLSELFNGNYIKMILISNISSEILFRLVEMHKESKDIIFTESISEYIKLLEENNWELNQEERQIIVALSLGTVLVADTPERMIDWRNEREVMTAEEILMRTSLVGHDDQYAEMKPEYNQGEKLTI